MIKFRLEIWLHQKNITPPGQYGSRKGFGTQEVITHIVCHIQKSPSENEILGTIYFNIAQIYDNVVLEILAQKILHIGLPTQVVRAIINIYTNRFVFIKQKNKITGPRITSQGIPQGSVLSPLLFNLYTIDIHTTWSPNISCLQYVDDFAIYSNGKQFQESISTLKHIV